MHVWRTQCLLTENWFEVEKLRDSRDCVHLSTICIYRRQIYQHYLDDYRLIYSQSRYLGIRLLSHSNVMITWYSQCKCAIAAKHVWILYPQQFFDHLNIRYLSSLSTYTIPISSPSTCVVFVLNRIYHHICSHSKILSFPFLKMSPTQFDPALLLVQRDSQGLRVGAICPCATGWYMG